MKLRDMDEVRVRSVDVVRRELDKIKQENTEGILTAESVVDSARHPDNDLHGYFEWDDATASEQWRLVQARQLIRWVKVACPDGEDAEPVQKYVSLLDDRKREGGGYRETSEVVSSPALLAQLEETARKELAAWLRRNSILKKLCDSVRKAAGLAKTKRRARTSD